MALKLINSSYHNGYLLSYFELGDSDNNVNYYNEYLNELSRRKENKILYKYSKNVIEDLDWYGVVMYMQIISNYESFLWIEGAIKKQ